jgi:hypothetical protein
MCAAMEKANACGAVTKTGTSCKRPGQPKYTGRCSIHANKLALGPETKIASPARPTRFERIERGFKFAGSVGSTAGGLYTLVKVIGYVVDHWTEIEHTFRIIMPTGRYVDYWEAKKLVKRREMPGRPFINAFERWYSDLPGYIRINVNREFGDIGKLVASARSETKATR